GDRTGVSVEPCKKRSKPCGKRSESCEAQSKPCGNHPKSCDSSIKSCESRPNLCGFLREVHHHYKTTRTRSFSMKKQALISVSDKTGITDFAKGLAEQDYDIISTGGTLRTIQEAGIEATAVEDVTGFPEMLEGRVKTLHPVIHAGLLAKRDDGTHKQQLSDKGITPIDVVVVNLYPFKQTLDQQNVTEEEIIENIDIGGPTMLRAAAKSFRDVTPVVDPDDYDEILQAIQNDELDTAMRKKLAAKVFRHTAQYDALIAGYFTDEAFPENYTVTYEKVQSLRYGENPHQEAAFYKKPIEPPMSLTSAKQRHG